MSSPSAAALPFGPDPLTPISFLERTEAVFGDRLGVIDGSRRFSYGELAARCRRLAGALAEGGVAPGDRVAVLAPNTSLPLEAHFGVPMAGAVLNALNHRLSADELGYIVGHAGAQLLLVDEQLADLGRALVQRVDTKVRIVVAGGADDEYEDWVASAAPVTRPVTDEWSLLSLNYTSGTTGRPKGVMYAHRGAYLQALAMAFQAGLDSASRFLWTLPMFHCNGWCFPWAVTAAGAAHVALRQIDPAEVWRLLREEGITHFNAAPTVLISLVEHPDARAVDAPVRVATGGAPPSPALLARLADLNIVVTHLYGLTETYGPAVICDWRPEWNNLPLDEQARIKARQGVGNVIGRQARVVDADGKECPSDGETQGEVVLRGNNVMLGYYRDPEATRAVMVDGPGGAWFKTGDVGVLHPDGYLELRDRSKDIIISGGENIASIEVEQALAAHRDVIECAVVAAPDPHWGEVPVAVVVRRPGSTVTEAELIAFVKERLARFKAPKRVVFDELPKTSTGKIQKFVLRERFRS